jgi:hypothetical protein
VVQCVCEYAVEEYLRETESHEAERITGNHRIRNNGIPYIDSRNTIPLCPIFRSEARICLFEVTVQNPDMSLCSRWITNWNSYIKNTTRIIIINICIHAHIICMYACMHVCVCVCVYVCTRVYPKVSGLSR